MSSLQSSPTSASGSWVFGACPPRKVDSQNLPECFGIGMVEKKVWGIRNRNGAVQNVVSDSLLIYSALKTQRLENPMEQPDCRADTKCFSKVLTRVSKFQLVWKFYWNKWKTVNLRNPTHGTGRMAVGAVQTPGICSTFNIFVSGV